MSIAENFALGINTTVIGMGIVFLVLIGLQLILMAQSKILGSMFKRDENEKKPETFVNAAPVKAISSVDKTGQISGDVTLVGVENDEMVALIMAIVSNDADIPMNQLRFKSIKAV